MAGICTKDQVYYPSFLLYRWESGLSPGLLPLTCALPGSLGSIQSNRPDKTLGFASNSSDGSTGEGMRPRQIRLWELSWRGTRVFSLFLECPLAGLVGAAEEWRRRLGPFAWAVRVSGRLPRRWCTPRRLAPLTHLLTRSFSPRQPPPGAAAGSVRSRVRVAAPRGLQAERARGGGASRAVILLPGAASTCLTSSGLTCPGIETVPLPFKGFSLLFFQSSLECKKRLSPAV